MDTRFSNNFSPNTSPQFTRSSTPRLALSLAIFASMVSLFLAATPGCGPGIRHASLLHPTVHASGETEITRDGLTFSVRPITWETAATFPQIVRTFNIRTPRGVVPGTGAIAPMPAFEVRITNHTGHVVRFTQSIIRLSDNLSRNYAAMPDSGRLLAWAQGAWNDAVAIDPSLSAQIASAVGALQIFSRNTELLNGDEWTGYLVFELPIASTADYRTLLDSITRFTLRIAEVPVEVGEAGEVTRTTEFSFTFDRTEYPQPVSCRGRGEPSWDICAME